MKKTERDKKQLDRMSQTSLLKSLGHRKKPHRIAEKLGHFTTSLCYSFILRSVSPLFISVANSTIFYRYVLKQSTNEKSRAHRNH